MAMTTVSLPFTNNEFFYCNSSNPCSNYSFIRFNFDITTPSVNNYARFYCDGTQFSVINFTPSSSPWINKDFYFSVFGNSCYVSTQLNSGSFNYELLSSIGGTVPSGTLNITQNGTYDVSSYASAEVDVPPVMGDYHDDLVRGVNAIYVLAGTILVIYFFYCIYRMIIKNVGDNK